MSASPQTVASAPSSRPRVPFQVATRRTGHAVARLSLAGQLDLRSAGMLARELLRVEGDVRRVVLDARGVSFMDAVGLHVLLHASQRAELGGWELVVIRGSRAIERLCRFPKMARRLRLVGEREALRPLRPPPDPSVTGPVRATPSAGADQGGRLLR